MKILDKINHLATLYLFLFFTMAFIVHYNFEYLKNYAKPYIEHFPIISICWIASLGIFSAHFFFHKIKKSSKSDVLLPIFEQFNEYIAYFSNAATYAIAASTSLILLRGASLQYFYKMEYFKEFQDIDLATMSFAMSFLLYWSIIAFIKAFLEIYSLKDVEIIQISNKNEDK